MGLKIERIKQGFSQSDLARRTRIAFRTIQGYESGKLDIEKASIKNVIKISYILKCPVERLLESEALRACYSEVKTYKEGEDN